MTDISVAIIVQNRRKALLNTLSGLANSTLLPEEVIIVHMNEDAIPLLGYPFKILSVHCESQHALPLASARNTAIEHASGNRVIFLDVDCIPDASLIENYNNAFEEEDILFTGHIRYLQKDDEMEIDLASDLVVKSTPDLIRTPYTQIPYELFWSLNFACSKQVFHKIGGFDEAFIGYGGEDTDFAFAARKANIGLRTVSATAYHQYHPSYSPPLNHLTDIVANANIFYEKWSRWPMEGWLKAFRERGYIKWEADEVTITRYPTSLEIAEVLKK